MILRYCDEQEKGNAIVVCFFFKNKLDADAEFTFSRWNREDGKVLAGTGFGEFLADAGKQAVLAFMPLGG